MTLTKFKKNSSCIKISYELLGSPAQQQDVDYFEHTQVVQSELDMILDPQSKARLNITSRVVRASLKLDYYTTGKIHGTADELKSRLIFGSCVVKNGIIRSLAQQIFEHTARASVSVDDVKAEFTPVETRCGTIGLAVINAQPVTAELLHGFRRQIPDILADRRMKALALVAGDSLYVPQFLKDVGQCDSLS